MNAIQIQFTEVFRDMALFMVVQRKGNSATN